MAGKASDYHHGDQDVAEQVATFRLIMNITKWVCLLLASGLLALVLWFCTGAGFMAGAISGGVVLVLGALLLRGGGGH